jgi:NAD(P)H-hydrate repair Nnr-like enzyme with NAD(P)H-hydrate dehydratase domain
MSGAAILSAKAALRTGVGLLKVACIEENYTALATTVPEAVLLPLKSNGKTFRMQDILEKFEVLGRHGEGHGSYWYLVGTCHADGNPYRVRYFFQYIDIQQY